MKAFAFAQDGLFLTGCTAYGVNRWLLKPHLASPFLHSHFNDLWLIPCALPLLLWVHRRLGLRGDSPPSSMEIAGHLLLWSLLFEWAGPKLFAQVTGDWRDVVCYWAGGLAAWLWWHRDTLFSRGAERAA